MRRFVITALVLLTAACTSSAVRTIASRPAHTIRPVPVSSTSAAPSSSTSAPSSPVPETPRVASTRASSSSSVVPRTAAGEPLVVLDPGHNGNNATAAAFLAHQVYAGYGRYKDCNTTGTETDAGYPEHAFTWDVAVRVRAILQHHGVRVVMTRANDRGVGPCVDQRANIESRPGVVAAVAVHADGGPPGGRGFHVCYDSRTPEGASAGTVARSLRLSRAVHDALARSSGLVESTYLGRDGYYPRDDLAGLNLSTSPTTFLELGNMRNAADAALLSSATGRARIAVAVAGGILAYLGR